MNKTYKHITTTKKRSLNYSLLNSVPMVYFFTRISFIASVMLIIGQPFLLADSEVIKVEPATMVTVGQEVFFDGSGITIPEAKLLPNGMIDGSYEWDFGDDSPLMSKSFYKGGGTIASHYFMRPGTYTVTLNVTDNEGLSKTETIGITVEGEYPKLPPRADVEPILELKFENNIQDTSDNGLVASWKTGVGSFVNGIEGMAADFTSGAYIEVSDPTGILNNMDELTVSLWAKKNNNAVTGTLLFTNDAFKIELGEGWPASINATVKTDSGEKCVNSLIADLDNTRWHHYTITYNSSNLRLFIDGNEWIESQHAPLDLTGIIIAQDGKLYIGKGSDANVFDGKIDEIKIYNKALTLKDITLGFELWHADFHAHISQYIYAQIPGVHTKNPNNKIKAVITGDNGYSKVLFHKNNIQPEEKFLLINSELSKGNYTLSVEIIDEANTIIDIISEKLEKPYDGAPTVGIDKNNSINLKGELFFPVTPWMLNVDYMNLWKAGKYINTLLYQGWQPQTEGNPWEKYLDRSISRNWYGSGPGSWGKKNINPNNLIDTITQTKDHPNQLLWMLSDEPALAGVPSPVLRGQTYMCHKLDPQHPVLVNFAGGSWASTGNSESNRKKYEYLFNGVYFGGKGAHVADILSVDYYPVEMAAKTSNPVAKMATILDTLRNENHNLLPYTSFVETTNLKELDVGLNRDLWYEKNGYSVSNATKSMISKEDAFNGYTFREGHLLYISFAGNDNHARTGLYTLEAKLDNNTIMLTENATDGLGDDENVTMTMVGTPPPTPEQIRMLAWLNVIHGSKGISWFHYFMPTPPENYPVMAEFTDHITRLTPIVLSEKTPRSLQDDANDPAKRVDTMIREDSENIWIIAVRLTEANETNNSPIKVTFELEGLSSKMEIIKPKEFSKTVLELRGNPDGPERDFSFTLDQKPIIPGTVQISGQYSQSYYGEPIFLYDDAKEGLYGIPVSWKYKDMHGRVDYDTGKVLIDFGQAKVDDVWPIRPILKGEDKVKVSYRPAINDRIIPHTGNTFEDTFGPCETHIYRIRKTPINVPVDANSIQSAIDSALDSDKIVVAPGVYYENINFGGKSIHLTSSNPDDAEITRTTIIDANSTGSAVIFGPAENGEPAAIAVSIVSGFTITGGSSLRGGGVYIDSASPIIENCIIKNNTAIEEGAGIYCINSNATIRQNEITKNTSEYGYGGGVYTEDSHARIANNIITGNNANFGAGVFSRHSTGAIANNTIAHNTSAYQWFALGITLELKEGQIPPAVKNNIVAFNDQGIGVGAIGRENLDWVVCNNFYNNPNGNYNPTTPDQTGLRGNISEDPFFFDAGNGGFRLKSTAGRWDTASQCWVKDADTGQHSPCIDAGDLNESTCDEMWPNGGKINMGAFGGTCQASLSNTNTPIDLNGDEISDNADIAALTNMWLTNGNFLNEDLNNDGTVNLADFQILTTIAK